MYNATMITDSDMIITNSLESYIKSMGVNMNNMTPNEMLVFRQQAKNGLYSDIIRRMGRVIPYILRNHNLPTPNKNIEGLEYALKRHIMDPDFVKLLMEYLSNPAISMEEVNICGGFIAISIGDYINNLSNNDVKKADVTVSDTKKNNKKDTVKEAPPTPEQASQVDMKPVEHLYAAATTIFRSQMNTLDIVCPGMNDYSKLAICAAISLNNEDSIKELINLDLPITSEIFVQAIIPDPTAIITGALLLEKEYCLKLTKNQQAFIDSVKEWIFDRLNSLDTQQCYRYLLDVYTSKEQKTTSINQYMKPDISKYYIYLNDCSTCYSHLKEVVKLF